jgi:hypothetical protein
MRKRKLYAQATSFMAAADWTAAKVAYKEALVDRLRSGFPLYGIAMASERSGDSEAAATEYADFMSAWKSADPNLPQIAHARDYLASHDTVAANK